MKVGFLGAGKMGEAMIAALISSRVVTGNEMFVCDVSPERRRTLKRRYGINTYAKSHFVVDAAEIIFVAVKPQNQAAVLAEISDEMTANHLVVSIAAGKTIQSIEKILPRARVVRVMPNLPCTVGAGVSVFCGGKRVKTADKKAVKTLLGSFGSVLEMPESHFDVVTAISGSGPAFFAYVLREFAAQGQKEGLSDAEALQLAEQTMLGTAKLLITQKIDPADLIAAVASPQGTTAAGLAVLDASDVGDTLRDTIAAASRRSKELSN